MTNAEREIAYLNHILECIEAVPKHISILPAGLMWHEHVTVREAVLRTLQIMAKSCTRLAAESHAAAPEVPWDDIRGFRHILVHDYLGNLNYDIITDTIKNDLPPLKAAVTRLLEEKK